MRLCAIFTASTLLLLGCDNSHKTIPRPLAKKAMFAIFVVSATETADTQPEADPESGETIYLAAPAVITSTDVASVDLIMGSPDNPSPSLNVVLTPTGGTKLSAATAAAKGMRLAIVVNDKVVAVPTINWRLSNDISVSGGKSKELFDLLTKD